MSTVVTLYGIPNCETVKKARAWLAERQISVAFHDFKKHGIPAERLDAWLAVLGWEKLINRQGTTWRKLDAPVKTAVTDAASARALMQAQPSVIKRPVVEWPTGDVTVGFDPDDWEHRL